MLQLRYPVLILKVIETNEDSNKGPAAIAPPDELGVPTNNGTMSPFLRNSPDKSFPRLAELPVKPFDVFFCLSDWTIIEDNKVCLTCGRTATVN